VIAQSVDEARSRIEKLVEKFGRGIKSYKNPKYNEEQVRVEFINPMFEALGWDIRNEQGFSETYKDVIHEDAIKIGGATKAPDYCFRIGGNRKFFLEAKKPAVPLKDSVKSAYQLRRYAWNIKLPLSILTDFEEFSIYDCRMEPKPDDRPNICRINYITFDEYIERLDEIYGVFAKESVLKGSFDKYVLDTKKRGTTEVDSVFLKEIESWRDLLSKNIALRNEELSVQELNFAVQRTIDRIIFLRMCEDRGIEDYGRLQGLINGPNVYERLCDLYYKADDKYNSSLFDFKTDTFSTKINIDDKVLKTIIKKLYYPNPYDFSIIPPEILGQVYEQFLGKVIRLTKGHQAKVEEKPEVRKAGGVYYTPQYIVNYIVKQTVGKLTEDKTPRQISKLRILDPACGSGSFLLGAYQYLLDYHLNWYREHNPSKYSKPTGKGKKQKAPALFKDRRGEWRLTTAEKKRILLNNIYGVDIDRQAVEVTKLSLLLKVLQDEDMESIGAHQLALFEDRVLPNLGDNIKCGNSLIGPDYFTDQILPDKGNLHRINPYDWKGEEGFPEIINVGGFDAVIGNPPYGDYFSKSEKNYLLIKDSDSFSGTFDIYINFFSLALKLLKDSGRLGFITPYTFLNYSQFSGLRRLLLKGNNISLILEIKNVFEEAVVDNAVIIITKSLIQEDTFKSGIFKENIDAINDNKLNEISSDNLTTESFLIKDTEEFDVNKLSSNAVRLGDYVKITQGITTGGNACFIGEKNNFIESGVDESLLKKTLKGKNIDRYKINFSGEFILYSTKHLSGNHQKGIASFLAPYKSKLSKKRETQQGKLPWYCLHWARNENDLDKEKILIRQTASKIIGVFDNKAFYPIDSIHTLNLLNDDNSQKKLQYILGILNSKLFEYLYHWKLDEVGKVFPQIKKVNIEWLPIRKIDLSDRNDKTRYERMVFHVERMLNMHEQLSNVKMSADRELYQRQIDATEREIDRLVYELYGLTEEEIRIVEGHN